MKNPMFFPKEPTDSEHKALFEKVMSNVIAYDNDNLEEMEHFDTPEGHRIYMGVFSDGETTSLQCIVRRFRGMVIPITIDICKIGAFIAILSDMRFNQPDEVFPTQYGNIVFTFAINN